MEPNLSKEEKEWNKAIQHHLDKYSYFRDWSELPPWLSKLKNMLLDYKGMIVDKVSLLKKLAISLNPSLPVAIHEATLEVY